MAEQKLCLRCEEWLVRKFGVNYYIPATHCHHDEPENLPNIRSNICELTNPKKDCVDYEMKIARNWCKDCIHWNKKLGG
jgi:hypothetical protein